MIFDNDLLLLYIVDFMCSDLVGQFIFPFHYCTKTLFNYNMESEKVKVSDSYPGEKKEKKEE